MTQFLNSPTMIVSGAQNVAILAELVAQISYQDLVNQNPATRITERQFEDFMGEMVPNFVDAGLLDENLGSTYTFRTAVSAL